MPNRRVRGAGAGLRARTAAEGERDCPAGDRCGAVLLQHADNVIGWPSAVLVGPVVGERGFLACHGERRRRRRALWVASPANVAVSG